MIVYLSADDTVATVKFRRVHVHRAALALGCARFATHEFRVYHARRNVKHDGETVTPVRRDDSVLLGHGHFETHCYSFLI